MSFRVVFEGIVIEASDAAGAIDLVRALRALRAPHASVSVASRAKQVKPRATRTRGTHARSTEGREAIAIRRERLLSALAGGEQPTQALLGRGFPRGTVFNDLVALEKAGRIERGERGYRLVQRAAMPESAAQFAGVNG